MKCIETFKTTASAGEKRRLLEERGIMGKIMVDPLESRSPELSSFQGVALMVKEGDAVEATGILAKASQAALKRAS